MSHFRILAAAAAMALAGVLVLGSPAAAHDVLLDSSPGNGEQLVEAPQTVSLSFSADVLPVGAAIMVVDQSGHDWVAEEPSVTGPAVTAMLDGPIPESGYEIRWRVVSSDGHPISGLIPFTVGDARPFTRTPPPTSGGADATVEQRQNTQEDKGTLRVILVGAGGAATTAAVLVLFSFLRRRKTAPAQPGGTGTPDDQ